MRLEWLSSSLLAWCPTCPDGAAYCRAERPAKADRQRVVRWAHRHTAETGHSVHFEEARIAILDAALTEEDR